GVFPCSPAPPPQGLKKPPKNCEKKTTQKKKKKKCNIKILTKNIFKTVSFLKNEAGPEGGGVLFWVGGG
ncbi:hypothetical protein, partial [Enterobacter intestinihominis]